MVVIDVVLADTVLDWYRKNCIADILVLTCTPRLQYEYKNRSPICSSKDLDKKNKNCKNVSKLWKCKQRANIA